MDRQQRAERLRDRTPPMLIRHGSGGVDGGEQAMGTYRHRDRGTGRVSAWPSRSLDGHGSMGLGQKHCHGVGGYGIRRTGRLVRRPPGRTPDQGCDLPFSLVAVGRSWSSLVAF